MLSSNSEHQRSSNNSRVRSIDHIPSVSENGQVILSDLYKQGCEALPSFSAENKRRTPEDELNNELLTLTKRVSSLASMNRQMILRINQFEVDLIRLLNDMLENQENDAMKNWVMRRGMYPPSSLITWLQILGEADRYWMFFAGVEGGSTGSRMVLLNQEGRILARSETGQTNQWQIGVAASASRIHEMLEECKTTAGVSGDIEALGLGLSGLDTPDACASMKGAVSKLNISKKYYMCNDTLSTLATATDGAGVVLIAGTGSNCLLVEDDGTSYRCGGWGHMLGDEGSAYGIAHTAMKILVDHQEGLKPCSMKTEYVFNAIKEHFGIDDRMELLQYLYGKFEKSFIATLAKKLSKGAVEGDELCQHVFTLAGRALGRHVQGVLRSKKSPPSSETLTIVCTGGVFKSFELLKSGFLEGILPVYEGDVQIPGFKLVTLKDTAAIGAAYLAAKHSKIPVVHQYQQLSEVFFAHTF